MPAARNSFQHAAVSPHSIRPVTAAALQKNLQQWYAKNRRSLPWRRDPTPYRVWISEIMLQQTQVKTVIPYYKRFLDRFPDIASLAGASEGEVLTLWAGLGYYSRARNLLIAARRIVEFHNGIFPTDYESVLALPGIGRYTAGAVCSIALNRPFPIVDGNIRRVIARLCGIGDKIPEKFYWDRMTAWVPEKNASVFNQAMMELGAVICLPAQPVCPECPVHAFCRAKRLNLQNKIPPPRLRQGIRRMELVVLVLKRRGKILLAKQKTGIIPGEWGLPLRTLSVGQKPLEAARNLNRIISGGAATIDSVARIRHSITRHRITMHVFAGKTAAGAADLNRDQGGMLWATQKQGSRLLTSSVFRKALEAARGKP